MYSVHQLDEGTSFKFVVRPDGSQRLTVDCLGAKYNVDMFRDKTTTWFSCDRHAYPDDLSIGFKKVIDESIKVRRYFHDIVEAADAFANHWGYDVEVVVKRPTTYEYRSILIQTRNVKTRCELHTNTANPFMEHFWMWKDSFRSRENRYTSTEKTFSLLEKERAVIETLKNFIRVCYQDEWNEVNGYSGLTKNGEIGGTSPQKLTIPTTIDN